MLILPSTTACANLWRKMLGMLFETGHPWVTFKDPCNLRSPQQHVGVVHSSNLCTEITLNTNKDEIAVCNLGSVNLAQHIGENGLDLDKLEQTVSTAVRMLDNVIDINYYSVPQAKNSNLLHRPVGLGLMGFQDALYKQHIAYGSDDAVAFADRSMEALSYFAIAASSALADERGAYSTFEGSLWSQGILPIQEDRSHISDGVAILILHPHLDLIVSHLIGFNLERDFKITAVGDETGAGRTRRRCRRRQIGEKHHHQKNDHTQDRFGLNQGAKSLQNPQGSFQSSFPLLDQVFSELRLDHQKVHSSQGQQGQKEEDLGQQGQSIPGGHKGGPGGHVNPGGIGTGQEDGRHTELRHAGESGDDFTH